MEDERAHQNYRYPNSFIEFPKEAIEESIIHRFEQQVRQRPGNLAVKFRDHWVTYSELNESANRLARTLLRFKQGQLMPVALLIEQGVTLIASILAVLKAGLSYAPLDRRQPTALLEKQIDDLRPGAIFTDDRNLHTAQAITCGSSRVINTEAVESSLSSDNLDLPLTPDTIAYIFYTSGSTGEPKGVVDIHRNVLHNVMRYTNTLGFSPEDRMSLVQHSSFSGTVSTLFGALLNGAAVFPYDLDRDGLSAIAAWTQQERITIFHSVPSIFRQLATTCEPYPELRIVRLEGDSATAQDIDIFQNTFAEDCVLVNGLGATECGLVRQYFIDKETKWLGHTVPVGYPVEDVDVHVIGKSGKDASAEDVGEIVIKSPYLALGYWRKPELTVDKFEKEESGLRTYRTGDLGSLSWDGCLKHLGRKDFQAKIGGNSVNMAHVENTILEIETVTDVLVQTYNDGMGEQHLAAYLVTQGISEPKVNDVREYLETVLPSYAIPTTYVFLERLPLTRDGKVDRGALPAPTIARPSLRKQYVTPKTSMEWSLAAIWAEVLELELKHIGVLDSFFALGGDSIRATQVVNRLSQRFGIEINVVVMFEYRTIRDLSGYLDDGSAHVTDRLMPTSNRPS